MSMSYVSQSEKTSNALLYFQNIDNVFTVVLGQYFLKKVVNFRAQIFFQQSY